MVAPLKFLVCVYFWAFSASAQGFLLEKPLDLPTPSQNIQKLQYSAQGNYLGAMIADMMLLLYDSEGQLIRQYSAPVHTIWSDFAFSPDEQYIVLAYSRQDSTFLQRYDMQEGIIQETIFLFAHPISVMEWHTDAQVLVCVSEGREIQAWQMMAGKLKRAHQKLWDKKDLDEAWIISANSNGRLWAVGGIGKELFIYEWKKQDLNLRQTLQTVEPIFGLAFHPTEPKLFISTAQTIKSYQYQKRDWIKTDSLPTYAPIASQLQMLKGNRGLVSAQENKLVLYGRQENGALEAQILWENKALILAHTPNPRFTKWAIATADGKARLFFIRERE